MKAEIQLLPKISPLGQKKHVFWSWQTMNIHISLTYYYQI